MRSSLCVAAIACAVSLLTTEAVLPDPDPEAGTITHAVAGPSSLSGALPGSLPDAGPTVDVAADAGPTVDVAAAAEYGPRRYAWPVPGTGTLLLAAAAFGSYQFALSDVFADTKDGKNRTKQDNQDIHWVHNFLTNVTSRQIDLAKLLVRAPADDRRTSGRLRTNTTSYAAFHNHTENVLKDLAIAQAACNRVRCQLRNAAEFHDQMSWVRRQLQMHVEATYRTSHSNLFANPVELRKALLAGRVSIVTHVFRFLHGAGFNSDLLKRYLPDARPGCLQDDTPSKEGGVLYDIKAFCNHDKVANLITSLGELYFDSVELNTEEGKEASNRFDKAVEEHDHALWQWRQLVIHPLSIGWCFLCFVFALASFVILILVFCTYMGCIAPRNWRWIWHWICDLFKGRKAEPAPAAPVRVEPAPAAPVRAEPVPAAPVVCRYPNTRSSKARIY